MFLRIRNRSLLCRFGWEENPEKGVSKLQNFKPKHSFSFTLETILKKKNETKKTSKVYVQE